MVNDRTLLLDLDGVSVIRVERLADGTRRVHLATADTSARACPACGVFASRVKGAATTQPRDLPYGEHGLEFSVAQTPLVVPGGVLSPEVVHRADPADTGRGPADRAAAVCGRTPGP